MSADQTASQAQATADAKVIPLPSARRRPLKICLLGYRSAPFGGGQGIYIKYLSKALVEAGHEVDVISGQPYPHVDPRVRLIKMPGMNLFENGLDSIRPHHLKSMTNIIEWTGKLSGGFAEPYCFGRRVESYLEKFGRSYDVIHDNQCLAWGMLNLQKKGFPLVTTIHHPVTSDLEIALAAAANWRERLLIRRWHSFLNMQKKVASQLDNVVTVSERSFADIGKAFDIPAERIKLIYCGIDTNEFRPMPEVQRQRHRIMATVSADQPLKGVRYLLEAIAKLVDKYPDISLRWVGKPREDSDTGELIKKLGIADRLHCVSGISTEDLVRYYNEAEVAVVPSVYEGFGLPAGEAMACGTPTIATTGGALPEVLGDAGSLVPIRDSDAIAAAIDELFENDIRRKQLSEVGRKRMEDTFCWSKAAEQFTDYYWQVIDANG